MIGLMKMFTISEELPAFDSSCAFLKNYRTCFHPKLTLAKELKQLQVSIDESRLSQLKFAFESDEIFDKLRFELYERDEKLKKKDDEFKANVAQEYENLKRLNDKLVLPTFDPENSVPLMCPTSDAALSMYALMRQIVSLSSDCLLQLCDKFEKLRDMCVARKAYKRQRITTTQLRDVIPFFLDGLQFVVKLLQEALMYPDLPPTMRQPENNCVTDRTLVIMCMMGSLRSALEINMWTRSIEILASFWYFNEEKPSEKKPASPKSLLGLGESGRLWASIPIPKKPTRNPCFLAHPTLTRYFHFRYGRLF